MRAKPGLLLRPPAFGPTMKRGHMIVNPIAKDLSGDTTFTRASTANYFDSSGILQSAAIDVPRFTYEVGTGTYLGFRVEGARTNLLLWNRDFTNAAWVKLLGTAAKTATGIDGVANSASTLTATSDGATFLQTITAAASSRTFAVYVKRITGTGAVSITQNGIDYTAITVTNAWTRSAILNASILNATPGIKLATSGDVIAVDYGHFEAGTFVSSPIATTTVSVARSADVPVISSVNTKPWFNSAQGTVFVNFQSEYAHVNFERIWQISDSGSEVNAVNLRSQSTTTNIRLNVVDNSVSQVAFDPGSTSWVGNTEFRAAAAYKANDCASSINSSSIATDTSCTIPSAAIDRLCIGMSGNSANQLFGTIKSLIYYPVKFPNAKLVAMTGA